MLIHLNVLFCSLGMGLAVAGLGRRGVASGDGGWEEEEREEGHFCHFKFGLYLFVIVLDSPSFYNFFLYFPFFFFTPTMWI